MTWRKSSRCAKGNCVEVASPAFRKSTRCSKGGCIEVATGDVVLMRDSKDPDGPVLAFDRSAWAVFTAAASTGRFHA